MGGWVCQAHGPAVSKSWGDFGKEHCPEQGGSALLQTTENAEQGCTFQHPSLINLVIICCQLSKTHAVGAGLCVPARGGAAGGPGWLHPVCFCCELCLSSAWRLLCPWSLREEFPLWAGGCSVPLDQARCGDGQVKAAQPSPCPSSCPWFCFAVLWVLGAELSFSSGQALLWC